MTFKKAYGVYSEVLQAGLATTASDLQKYAGAVVDAFTGPDNEPVLITDGYEGYKNIFGFNPVGAESRVPLKTLLNTTPCYIIRAVGAGSKKPAAFIVKADNKVYPVSSNIGITSGEAFGEMKTIVLEALPDTSASIKMTVGDVSAEVANTSANKDLVLKTLSEEMTKAFASAGYSDGEVLVLDNNPSNQLSYSEMTCNFGLMSDLISTSKVGLTVKQGVTVLATVPATEKGDKADDKFIEALNAAVPAESTSVKILFSEVDGNLVSTVSYAKAGAYSFTAEKAEGSVDMTTEMSLGKGMVENNTLVLRYPGAMDPESTTVSVNSGEDVLVSKTEPAGILAYAEGTGVVSNNISLQMTINDIDLGKPVIQVLDTTKLSTVASATCSTIVNLIVSGEENALSGDLVNGDMIGLLTGLLEPYNATVEAYGKTSVKITMAAGNEMKISEIKVTTPDNKLIALVPTASDYVAPNGTMTVTTASVADKVKTADKNMVTVALVEMTDETTGKNIYINEILGEYSNASMIWTIKDPNTVDWMSLIGKTIKLSGGKYIEPTTADLMKAWNKFYDKGAIPVVRMLVSVNKSNTPEIHKLMLDIAKSREVTFAVMNVPAGYASREDLLEYRNVLLGSNTYFGRLEGNRYKMTDDLTGVNAIYDSAGETAARIIACGYNPAAGINGARGVVASAIDVDTKYSEGDRDFLDPAGVNITLNKGSLGCVIYGESTLQVSTLPLHDTHNVIIIQDLVIKCKDNLEYSMFTLNDANTRMLAKKRLEAQCAPFLTDGKIAEYIVDMDITKEDPVDVALGVMVAKVYVRMLSSVKWILLRVYALDSAISLDVVEAAAV